MTTRRALVAVVAAVMCASAAAAEPKLKLDREPPPKGLRMRRIAQKPAPKPAPAPAPVAPAAPGLRGPAAPATTPAAAVASGKSSSELETAALRDLDQRLSFSIDLGYQLDSAVLSDKPSLDRPAPLDRNRDFQSFRAYGFGELFGSTRGVGLASLSTYFAVRFQAARVTQDSTDMNGAGDTPRLAPPISTWFERSGVEQRTGWAELRDFLPQRWGLSRLRVRAGTQHVYGPWVVHMDGFVFAYDGPILSASLYTGFRRSDYTREAAQPDDRAAVGGASVRVDLRGLKRALPLALQAEVLSLGASKDLGSPQSNTALFQGDWRPRQDVAMILSLRTLNGDAASQRLEVRARYKEVTNLVLDINRHTRNDWQWDPAIIRTNDATAAKRYLDLGPQIPRLVASLRAGTLIAENVDLLLRGALAGNVGEREDEVNTFLAPYAELGGAAEVRLRRTIALTGSVLSRDTRHDELLTPVMDVPGTPDAIPANRYRGEEGFTEVGGALKLTLGARSFSTQIEFFGRRTRYAPLYEGEILVVPDSDTRYGGRISLDAWVGNQLRLFAAYDASSSFDFQPEINGYKSLRLMLTGVY